MTTTPSYKKELYSLPIEIVDELVAYAKETHQKKSHIVADALAEYMKKRDEKKRIEEIRSVIGVIGGDMPTPDIQEIKASRYQL
jgi:hypothetical protein